MSRQDEKQKSLATRRSFLAGAGAVVGATIAPAQTVPAASTHATASSSFAEILRTPDMLRVLDEQGSARQLTRSGEQWSSGDITVRSRVADNAMPLELSSPTLSLTHVHLRWRASIPAHVRVLCDAWERSYGELAWMPLRPERPLPWYFLAHDGVATHGYGVRTGAGSLAFWQVDTEGISLWLDVRNGGSGVVLGERTLQVATVVTRRGADHEDTFAAARSFAGVMASKVTLRQARGRNSLAAIYGSNDWYYAYGKNSADGILRDADLMAELAPPGALRPYTVIDDGWQYPDRYGDLGVLAGRIRAKGVVPGIWIRPLQAAASTDPRMLLPSVRYGAHADASEGLAYDPTIPEASALAIAKCTAARQQGYELIKHDFSTYELLGQWGNHMGASPTLPGWHLHDRSLTNAEVVTRLYQALRDAAGDDTVLLACNTIGHLSAGLCDAQRTGDDVSGRMWERTRRTGVNTLAFRLPQHGKFFIGDADCVPFTRDIPWSLTEQWLRAVAASGTTLLVSPAPDAIGTEQKKAIREAFAVSAMVRVHAQPADWMNSPAPSTWRVNGTSQMATYDWEEPQGAWPFET